MSFILHYHDVVVRSDDLATLDESSWLNDTIIEFYMEYAERIPLKSRTDILLLRPAMVQLLTHSTESPEVLKAVLPPDLDKREVIFVPVNDGSPSHAYDGSHWSLIVFYRPTRTFYYYDSMGTTNLGVAKRTMFQLKRLLGDRYPYDVVVPGAPQQTNGADCGVIVIAMIEHLLKSLLRDKQGDWSGIFGSIDDTDIMPPSATRNALADLLFSLREKQAISEK